MSSTKRVAVIGAGPVGLCAIKCLKEEGIQPVCFEKTPFFGGLWRYHADDVEGLASVMNTTIINTSKEMGALSDFPMPEDFANYMHHTQVLKYLTMYAEKFDLLQHIHYNKEVIKVDFAENYNTTGRLTVTVKDTESNEISEDTFDGVFVCIGHHVYPNVPTFPGQEKFKGNIMHTHSLKKVDGFSDQAVAVVGVGNSGMDAAVEISSVSKQVYLSTRKGAWVFPRVGPYGMPIDMAFTTRFMDVLFQLVPYNLSCWSIEKWLNYKFNHSLYDLKPEHRVFSQHPSMSDSLPIKLLSGTVKIKGNIKQFTEDGVLFERDQFATKVDSVVLATGYKIKFPFLSDALTVVKENKVHLYKFMYPPHLPHHTLVIMGLVQSVGALLPIAEAQCRLASLVIKEKIKLPSREAMEKSIELRNEWTFSRYTTSERHTVQVDYIQYSDEINEMFGAKPNLLKLLISDPKLFYILFFGPSLPYQYRLQGPHQWTGAREAILTYKRRVLKPLKEHYTSSIQEVSFTNVMLQFALFLGLLVVLKIFLGVA